MEFNWINIFDGIIVLLILIPNIIHALRRNNADERKIHIPMYLKFCEQIGRYGCMILMILPLFVWKFGFNPMEFLFVYLGANAILMISYYMCWIAYSRKKGTDTALALAVIPTLIFIVSGYLLEHWALIIMAAVFGISHCTITVMTHKNTNC